MLYPFYKRKDYEYCSRLRNVRAFCGYKAGVCVIGLPKALKDYEPKRGVPFVVYKEYAAMREVHEYIRTMRTGFTVQSNDEYLRLHKAMRLFREYGNKSDTATIEKISKKIGASIDDIADKTYRKALNKKKSELTKQGINTV